MTVNGSCVWLVQSTVRGKTLDRLEAACADARRSVHRIQVIPFVEEIPGHLLPTPGPFVFYGYTTLMLAAYRDPEWRRGIFFDPERFTPAAYHAAWGTDFLNHDARLVTFSTLAEELHAPDERLFIRPNDDLKRFTGEVMTFGAYREWYSGFAGATDMDLYDDTEIVVASVKEISAEWRLFYVGGVRVTESCYRPTIQRGVPVEIADWADSRVRLWSPAEAFVMDVALLEDGRPMVIECNCINGSGLYEADVHALVRAVSAFQEARWSE